MTRPLLLLTLLTLLTAPATALSGQSPAPSPGPPVADLALVGGTLVDGFTGDPLHNSVILVRGERIVAVGTTGTLEVPADAEVVDTEGMTVLPGLWDMHVHLMLVGHADYAHWDETYPPLFEDVIMPAAARRPEWTTSSTRDWPPRPNILPT